MQDEKYTRTEVNTKRNLAITNARGLSNISLILFASHAVATSIAHATSSSDHDQYRFVP